MEPNVGYIGCIREVGKVTEKYWTIII